jgi:hypothetical protein
MKMEVKRYWIDIWPETETDEAYLEAVLGCRIPTCYPENPPPVVEVQKIIGAGRIAGIRISKADVSVVPPDNIEAK